MATTILLVAAVCLRTPQHKQVSTMVYLYVVMTTMTTTTTTEVQDNAELSKVKAKVRYLI